MSGTDAKSALEGVEFQRHFTCYESASTVLLISQRYTSEKPNSRWTLRFTKHDDRKGFELDVAETCAADEEIAAMLQQLGRITRKVEAFGILGLVRFLEGSYVVLVTKRVPVLRVEDCAVYEIGDISMIPCFTPTKQMMCGSCGADGRSTAEEIIVYEEPVEELEGDEDEQKTTMGVRDAVPVAPRTTAVAYDERKYKHIFVKALNMLKSGGYFSYSLDLTKTVQQRTLETVSKAAQKKKNKRQETFGGVSPSPSAAVHASGSPTHEEAERQRNVAEHQRRMKLARSGSLDSRIFPATDAVAEGGGPEVTEGPLRDASLGTDMVEEGLPGIQKGKGEAWNTANDMFVFNAFLLRPLLDLEGIEARRWALPVIFGAVKGFRFAVGESVFTAAVIARRGRQFFGPRYFKRGISGLGHVANEVEVEQAVWQEGVQNRGFLGSVVLLRGSIPLHWGHQNVMQPQPAIKLHREEDPTLSHTMEHFTDLLRRYESPIVILNMVRQSPGHREERLSAWFEEAIATIQSRWDAGENAGDTEAQKRIKYMCFDWLAEEKRGGMETALRDLMGWAKGMVDDVGFFCEKRHGDAGRRLHKQPSSVPSSNPKGGKKETGGYREKGREKEVEVGLQIGIYRINCVDCLDRTNIGMFVVALECLGRQLRHAGIGMEREDEKDNNSSNVLRLAQKKNTSCCGGCCEGGATRSNELVVPSNTPTAPPRQANRRNSVESTDSEIAAVNQRRLSFLGDSQGLNLPGTVTKAEAEALELAGSRGAHEEATQYSAEAENEPVHTADVDADLAPSLPRPHIVELSLPRDCFLPRRNSTGEDATKSPLPGPVPPALAALAMDTWGTVGDALANQYGGSAAMHRPLILFGRTAVSSLPSEEVNSLSAGSREDMEAGVCADAPWKASRRGNAAIAVERYLTNVFSDLDRQRAWDLFLGKHVPADARASKEGGEPEKLWKKDLSPTRVRQSEWRVRAVKGRRGAPLGARGGGNVLVGLKATSTPTRSPESQEELQGHNRPPEQVGGA
uniref:SAC domain-containing protein n=1 Tax=Chromera velia CCMP2878 TaxID=1169474 RepID=A0A0G4HP26_9ALVE|eukprot:Cvel_7773.t1-p1 / transcript=Cvel_7773.t1 / gene=Cvel_7773 / organism=Chromera_velia_CCMP2878 / gene_product=Phosphoinositide phosphatase SAC5, putative / transcript_product=Phosphoinositide phosphatase SAC5, putative / location=Cvel_scaffold414:44693-52958(+) / protein_length=1021 / sequence_SO=supercontig / SO=protein_coding / is_pseudo=false